MFLHTEKVKEMRVIHKNHIVMYRGKLCSRDIAQEAKMIINVAKGKFLILRDLF